MDIPKLPLKEFSELNKQLQIFIMNIICLMPIWFLNIYFFSHFFNSHPIYISIVISFCLSLSLIVGIQSCVGVITSKRLESYRVQNHLFKVYLASFSSIIFLLVASSVEFKYPIPFVRYVYRLFDIQALFFIIMAIKNTFFLKPNKEETPQK